MNRNEQFKPSGSLRPIIAIFAVMIALSLAMLWMSTQ